MKQYSGEENKDDYVIRFKSYSKRHLGKPGKQVYQVRIPIRILNELREKGLREYYKILLNGPTKHVYYWRYSESRDVRGKRVDRVISIAGLKEGLYDVEIRPYSLNDFIKEFNQLIKGMYDKIIKLEIRNDNLILNVDGYEYTTHDWRMDKVFGGAIGIVASYKIEAFNPRLIFKIRGDEADIRLLEYPPEKSTKGYRILDLEPSDIALKIKYITGNKRIRRTYITRTSSIISTKIEITQDNLKVRKYRRYPAFDAYIYNLDKDAAYMVDILWNIANSYKRREITLHNKIKSELGVAIAKAFLTKKKRFKAILDKEHIKEEYTEIKRAPDLVIFLSDRSWIAYKVKMISNIKHIRRTFNEAVKQIRNHVKYLRESGILVLTYGIIVVSYNPRESKGYIFFGEYKIGEKHHGRL